MKALKHNLTVFAVAGLAAFGLMILLSMFLSPMTYKIAICAAVGILATRWV